MSDKQTQVVTTARDAYVAGRDIYLNGARPADPLYDRSRPVFVQYLNPEILHCYGFPLRRGESQLTTGQALYATRLAVLATDANLVMPASYLFEVPGIPRLLELLRGLVALQQVAYCAPVPDVVRYGEQKAAEYRADPQNPYVTPTSLAIAQDLVWSPRGAGSTADHIARRWDAALSRDGELARLAASLARHWPPGHREPEGELRAVPERLGEQAFVTRFVARAIPARPRPEELARIGWFVSRAYLSSYLHDLDAIILRDFPFGGLSCGVEHDPGVSAVSARSLDLALQWLGLAEFIHVTASWAELVQLRSNPEFGSIAVASQSSDRMEGLRRAVVRSRASRPAEVKSLAQAESAVRIAADSLYA
ncbi:hypothetical protein B0I31_103243 [Saccharothrix carnea]|uniref:Uncharacterized protein n=1 Tax=Saccharothrix carnea TaxID=1280637 RepID=A0A2P8IDF4_SACCR|nr:hypothetical protein [Saccharothrix carnea]PSL56494.1 hypothetical protein B0I31_103243 [Saccharothrix carnea]